MGLDIYLERFDDFEDVQKRESAYRDFETKIWEEAGGYKDLTEEKKKEISQKCEEFALSLNLDRWGSCEEGVEKIELNSAKYPEHMFKIGYFRSSYNEGGINSILRNFGLPDLQAIFGVDNEEHFIQPDWKKCIERVEGVINDLQGKGNFRIHPVFPEKLSSENLPSSPSEALNVFISQKDNHNEGDKKYNYRSKEGEFFFEQPLNVVALIPGNSRYIFQSNPCVFVVSEEENANKWYIESLEIVKETMEYVLAQKNISQYYLRWSG